MESQYVFADSQPVNELERLQAIEKVFDPASRRRILATGLTTGWRCLEVGAGAGSILNWMVEVVGKTGKVVAVDIDTRFVANTTLSNVEILQGDIRHIPLESGSFDLIHVRYVLIHIADFQVTLSKMLDWLKPGGWMVVEEPDFAAARAIAGDAEECKSVDRVNRAIFRMFSDRGMDYALGVKLPSMFQKLGLQEIFVENDTPLSEGGSGVASMMKLSTLQLAQRYMATGETIHEDIQRYCRFAEKPDSWAIYYATVGVIGQKA